MIDSELELKMAEICREKMLAKEHSAEDIHWLINHLDRIADEQLSAWLMAVCINGLSKTETSELTRSMAFSGHVLTLQRHADCDLEGPVKLQAGKQFVDKHSTGGVGDKTSIVLGPLLAALGFKISKFSGRALGHTGGTIDKLETIPAFKTDIDMKKFERQIDEIGLALAAQTEEFAPADKKLYALRDRTGSVQSIPLIAASVMSKKIAAGADHIILDVKAGSGAFMKNKKEAKELAQQMVDIGAALNLSVEAFITDMNQPLGTAIGNLAETLEAISMLKGFKNFAAYLLEKAKTNSDFVELASHVNSADKDAASDFYQLSLELASSVASEKELETAIGSGEAYQKFKEWVRAQSDADQLLDICSKYSLDENIETDDLMMAVSKPESYSSYQAESSAWLKEVDSEALGLVVHEMAAASSSKSAANQASIFVWKKIGEQIMAGENLFTLAGHKELDLEKYKQKVLDCFTFSRSKTKAEKLVKERIKASSPSVLAASHQQCS